MAVSQGKVAAVREHQIVISLKPEQFQEVQKQARAAGAQSVGAFVRQNLLLFLGLEEAEAAKKSSSSLSPAVQADPDWKFIASELRRLHRELKVLSSEAAASTTLATDLSGNSSAGPLLASTVGLAENYVEPPAPAIYEAPRAKENFLTQGAPLSADDYDADLDDGYEESLILPPAHGMSGTPAAPYFGTPSIRSPFGLPLPSQQLPLSSPFSAHTFMPNIAPLPADLGMTTSPAAETYDPDLVEEIVSNFARPGAQSVPQQPVAAPEQNPVSQPAAEAVSPAQVETQAERPAPVVEPIAAAPLKEPAPPVVAQAVPENTAEPVASAPSAPPRQGSPQPRPVSQSANEAGAFAPQKDDMEVLADRAFAISPRLGAIEPEVVMQPAPTRSFADTLEELLDAGLINQVLSQPEKDDASDEYAGEVQAPPEDFVADEDVQVYVQEVEVASTVDATDSESDAQSDKTGEEERNDDEDETPQVIQHEPPPPPKPIGYDDTPDENEPPKPPPRRKKLM